MAKWKHDDLMRDLAEHLAQPNRMIWCDMQMGPSGSPRPDVYTMQKSYTNPKPVAYECKVSVADFRSDVTAGKWQSYLDFACGVYFAVPAGLISKADLPSGCGLIVRGDTGWRVLKAPTLNPVSLPERGMLKLLIDGVERAQLKARVRHFNAFVKAKELGKQFGDDVATTLNDLMEARRRIEDIDFECERIIDRAKRDAERIVRLANDEAATAKQRVNDLSRDLRDAVGLEDAASMFEIKARVNELCRDLDVDDRLARARREISYVEKAISRAKSAVEIGQ